MEGAGSHGESSSLRRGTAGAGSSTMTLLSEERQTPPLMLRLRAETPQSVDWSQDVVDNEHLNRKKSKRCCIYHKPRPFDESGTESSSGAESEEDEFEKRYPGFAGDRKIAKKKKKENASGHSHGHHYVHGHSHGGHVGDDKGDQSDNISNDQGGKNGDDKTKT